MPLEELLALYGYGNQHDTEVEALETPPESQEPSNSEEECKMQLEHSKLQQLYDPIPETDQEQDGPRLRC